MEKIAASLARQSLKNIVFIGICCYTVLES